MDWAGCFSPIPFLFEINLKKDMKKILIIVILSLLSLTAFSQIPFKIHNKDIRFKWGSDSMRFDITGKGFYLRDTIYFADGTKQWSADTVGGVAGNWSMSGLKIYPTTPGAYVNTDSSYYIKGVDFIRYNKTKESIGIGLNAIGPYSTGGGNIAIGSVSLYSNSTGNNNIGIGKGALNNNIIGNNNISMGLNSLYNSLIGGNNTSIGALTLYQNTIDSNNIALGYRAGYAAQLSNRLWIGEGDSNTSIIYGHMGNGIQYLRFNANVKIKDVLTANLYTPPVLKTSNDTLLKTETVVLASGDITLVAPAITAADNGLTITVKNTGTYTDLVHFNIPAPAKADSINDAYLTRWMSRTIVAYNGKWYTKEKIPRTDYVYDVSYSGSFQSIPEVVAFVTEHMQAPSVVRLGGGDYTIPATQIINLPYTLAFRGFDYQTTNIYTMR